MRSLALASALVLPLLRQVSASDFAECTGPITQTTYIGKHKNVRVDIQTCKECTSLAEIESRELHERDNVCGAACTTYCWTPAGGGPDPNECNVIADALLYDSQNVGALFTMDPGNGTQKITMQYHSCLTYILNQDSVPLTYCRTDWSQLVNYIALNCQAQQNAHGGLCAATDQRWYVQVQATGT